MPLWSVCVTWVHGAAEGASSTAASCVIPTPGWLPPPSLLDVGGLEMVCWDRRQG